jgi:ectoine hydroxylase
MFRISPNDIQRYQDDGYLLVPGLFDAEEVGRVLAAAHEDKAIHDQTHHVADGQGGVTKISAWYDLGDDIYSQVACCPRVADTMARLMGDEIYHYHTKLILKDPYEGGAWAWHQDYGYWYYGGYVYPDMGSCMIALDRATRDNGCLQVLRGSHKLGRIDHVLTGEQSGADLERLEQAKKLFPLVHCEMEPGTALFFDSNLLHASAQNKSPNPRWALIHCYTAAHNTSYRDPYHPQYAPMPQVPDEAIRRCEITRLGKDRQYAKKEGEKYMKKGQ